MNTLSKPMYIVSRAICRFSKKVMSTEDTLKYICINKISISRYGDGEFGLMRRMPIGFQKYNKSMAVRLKDIASRTQENLLVCIPHTLCTIVGHKDSSKKFWYRETGLKYFLWVKMFSKQKLLGDSMVSRFYMDYNQEFVVNHTKKIINLWKKIWNERDVLIVEGRFTRLGIGNDLFSNAKSISRIIAPSQDAYEKYEQILCSTLENVKNDQLVLIALGPTATILAADLSKHNIQAIDIGHIDIEYEWYIIGAKTKVSIPSKAVNEVKNGLDVDVEINDTDYLNQIICTIS